MLKTAILKTNCQTVSKQIRKRSGIELHQFNVDHTFELPVTATNINDIINAKSLSWCFRFDHRSMMEPLKAKKVHCCNQ